MQLLRDAQAVRVEARFQRQTGEWVDAQISATPLRDEQGHLTGWLGIGRDISDQRRASERTSDVLARLEDVLNGSNDGIWECHLPTGRCTFNRRWAEMLGYDLSDIEPSIAGWEGLVHPDDLAGAWARVQAHLDGVTDAFQFECRLRHRDGHWIWVWDRGRIVERDVCGVPLRTAGTHTDITARRESAELLQAREEELRSIVTAMAEGVILLGADGRIRRCNSAAEHILGLTQAQMEGRGSSDPRWRAIHEDGSDYPGETHPSMQALRTGRPVRDAIMGVHRPDGELRWILINAEPLRRADTDAPYAVVTTFADITALRGATQQLALSEERYRGLFENLLEEVRVYDVVRDERGTVIDWVLREENLAASRLADQGRPAIGARMVEAYGDAMRPLIAQSHGILAGNALLTDLYFAPADGWYLASFFALGRDSIVSVALDVTERRTAERKLRESEARFRTVVERASDAIHLTNLATGRIELMNARYVEMLGWPEDELRGQSSQDALEKIHPDDRQRVVDHWQRLLESGAERAEPIELRTRTKAGEYRWISRTRSVVRDEQGQPQAVIGVSHDITERKRIEEVLVAEVANKASLVRDLRETLATKTLGDFLPTCMYCKRIRDVDGRWHRLEEYITRHTGSLFSHGLCPACSSKMLEELRRGDDESK